MKNEICKMIDRSEKRQIDFKLFTRYIENYEQTEIEINQKFRLIWNLLKFNEKRIYLVQKQWKRNDKC